MLGIQIRPRRSPGRTHLLLPLFRLLRLNAIVFVLVDESLQLLLQICRDSLITGLAVKIGKFIRIFLEVVEFPFIAEAIEIHELVTRGPNAVVTWNHVHAGVFVVVVVNARAPIVWVAPFEEGHEGPPLHVLGNGGVGNVQKRLCVIKVLNHVRAARPRDCRARPFDDEGHLERFFIHPALIVPTVVADVEALVRGIDDDGIFIETQLFESAAKPSDAFIDALDAAKVVLGIALVLPTHEIFASELRLMKRFVLGPVGGAPGFELAFAHPLHVVPSRAVLALLRGFLVELWSEIDEEVVVEIHVTIDLKFLMACRRGVVFPVVEERGGLGDRDVVIQMQVSDGRHPTAMRGLVLDHEHEGLLRISITGEPVHGGVRDNVRAIALHLHAAFGRDEKRVVVVALSWKHFPIIKTLGLALQMGLPIERGLVAFLLKDLRKRLLIPVEGIAVVHEAILVAVLS